MLSSKACRKNSKYTHILSLLYSIRSYNVPLDLRILLTGYYLKTELGLQNGFEYVQRYKGDVLFGHFLTWGHGHISFSIMVVTHNVELDHWNRLSTLISLGINKEDLLLLAIKKGRPKIVERLINSGVDVSRKGLIERALFEDRLIIFTLLFRSVDFNHPIYTGRIEAILQCACSHCGLKVIRLLVKKGLSFPPVKAEHDKLDPFLMDLLIMAISNPHDQVFKWMICKYRLSVNNIYKLVPEMVTQGKINLLQYIAKKYKLDYSSTLESLICGIELFLYENGDEETTHLMLEHIFQYSNKKVDIMKLVESVNGSIFIIDEIVTILKWNFDDHIEFLNKVSKQARLNGDSDIEERVSDELKRIVH